jgi:peptidyl-prolyl cis-trans isomerase B (cyclophilin B)
MAHAGRNTGGSQFYICYGAQPHLDGVHTVFGKVVQGMELVDAFRGQDRMESVVVK